MAEKGVWWSLQPFVDNGNSRFPEGSPNRLKQDEMRKGTDIAYSLAKKYNKMATSSNAELLRMSVKRAPYQKGKLGEISVGAYADLILVNGNPLNNIKLVENPDANFVLIMKDGVIYKNTLSK